MISHKKKFVFVHIPRTGGTAIEQKLKHYCNEDESAGHDTALEIKEKLGDKWDKYYTFALVRNPWDRIVSVYSYAHQSDSVDMIYPGFRNWIIGNQKKIQRKMMMPQTHWLYDENKQIIVEHVYKFEDLDNAWKKLCKDLHISHSPLDICVPSKHKHYSEYYDWHTARIVEDMYDNTVRIFKYGFDFHAGKK